MWRDWKLPEGCRLEWGFFLSLGYPELVTLQQLVLNSCVNLPPVKTFLLGNIEPRRAEYPLCVAKAILDSRDWRAVCLVSRRCAVQVGASHRRLLGVLHQVSFPVDILWGIHLRPTEVPGCHKTCAEQSLFGRLKPHCLPTLRNWLMPRDLEQPSHLAV